MVQHPEAGLLSWVVRQERALAVCDPVLDKLARLRASPALYIGRHSAEALFLYLAGYRDALHDHAAGDTSLYREFVEGLNSKYGHGGGGHSWAWVLGQVAGGDAAGLDLLFAELAAFEQKHAEQSATADPTPIRFD